jgi:hypothetical protein
MSQDNQDDRDLEQEAMNASLRTHIASDGDKLDGVWLSFALLALLCALTVPFGLWKICELVMLLWRTINT